MSTDQKTIDAYDKHARSWADSKQDIKDSISIFHVFLEKPALYGKLPNLKGKSVLCVGCGSGEEVEHLKSHGAEKVVGIDISSGLIEIAKKNYPNLEFHTMDAEKLDFPKESFDVVFSSLTMHYLESWTKALEGMYEVLKPNGECIFSITHPFFSATKKHEDEKVKSRTFGYREHKESHTCEVTGDYLNPKKVEVCIGKDLVVTNYHRPLSIIMKEIVSSGFEVVDIVEPKALDESKKDNPIFWEVHQKIPEFMIFELMKINDKPPDFSGVQ